MVWEHTLCDLNPFKYTETCFMAQNVALKTVDMLLPQGLCTYWNVLPSDSHMSCFINPSFESLFRRHYVYEIFCDYEI